MAKGGFFGCFSVEALHHFDGLKDLASVTADLSNRLLASVGELSHPAAENQYGDQRHGDNNQNHQAELEIGDHHERQRTRERESVAHRQAD